MVTSFNRWLYFNQARQTSCQAGALWAGISCGKKDVRQIYEKQILKFWLFAVENSYHIRAMHRRHVHLKLALAHNRHSRAPVVENLQQTNLRVLADNPAQF
jgi:hypothetical protein